MRDPFSFDVFLSHSSKDKAIVREIADSLRKDGLRVWLDEWEIKPGDSIPARIEDGLELSRVLVLTMSVNAFGSDWARLESYTFRFRDPLNKERRFIPLRLDEAPIKGTLAQFHYVDWLSDNREREYAKLLEACRPITPLAAPRDQAANKQTPERIVELQFKLLTNAYTFSPNGKRVLTAHVNSNIGLWDMESGRQISTLYGPGPDPRLDSGALAVAWGADPHHAISGLKDGTVRVWDVETGKSSHVLQGHGSRITSLTWSSDERLVLCGAADGTVRIWELSTERCLSVLEGHRGSVNAVAWDAHESCIISGGDDATVRLWEVATGRCLKVLEGHTDCVTAVALSADEHLALSGSADHAIRMWDVATGRCLSVFEGHTDCVIALAWRNDQRLALSGSADHSVRLWDIGATRCVRVLEGHTRKVVSVAWSDDQIRAFSGDFLGGINVWDLSEFVNTAWQVQRAQRSLPAPPDQVLYTNAKVLLVGESGVGKTGLSKALAGEKWQPSDSTVGAWATQWRLPVSSDNAVERDIWLWDFGGQADQRLIHQLYMEDTALAVLVFDGQKDDLFETLSQWDRDVSRASQKPFTKILVAGRVDTGGIRASRTQIEAFANERGFACFLETSAKANIGCVELKNAILTGIAWTNIPWHSSPLLFKRLKEEIIQLRDEGRVLMRFNELRDALRLRLPADEAKFKDEDLKAVVGLLAGPGVVWNLEFGSWVLLHPESINAYAQAVIQTIREDKYERGVITEERVLSGTLSYQSSAKRLDGEEERFILLAMHQTLVERGLCFREYTDKGPLLIFPSYCRRERPELVGHPAVLVSYRFNGFLDDIYATLIVRLQHTEPFQQDELWRYAADFKTLTGKQLGVKLTRRSEGSGELEVYFDSAIPLEEKIIFSRYVHEHVLQKRKKVVRLRHYVCPSCGTPVNNREVAMKRLETWLTGKGAGLAGDGQTRAWFNKGKSPTILCVNCEKRVPLWDEMEESFASPEMQKRVRELQEQSATILDNESKERALVGEVISTVALAGQISREFSVSDHGIDMEIEFKNAEGEATGQKLYLQLKSGDSYLRERQSDGTEVFEIKKKRHADYWMAQAFPVMLVIRASDGEVRWMEVRDWLRRASSNGQRAVKQIVFEGVRFDVMSVRGWRDRVLRV